MWKKKIYGKALSNVWKKLQEEMLQKKTFEKYLLIFLVPSQRFQHFRQQLQNLKLQLVASFFSISIKIILDCPIIIPQGREKCSQESVASVSATPLPVA